MKNVGCGEPASRTNCLASQIGCGSPRSPHPTPLDPPLHRAKTTVSLATAARSHSIFSSE